MSFLVWDAYAACCHHQVAVEAILHTAVTKSRVRVRVRHKQNQSSWENGKTNKQTKKLLFSWVCNVYSLIYIVLVVHWVKTFIVWMHEVHAHSQEPHSRRQ